MKSNQPNQKRHDPMHKICSQKERVRQDRTREATKEGGKGNMKALRVQLKSTCI